MGAFHICPSPYLNPTTKPYPTHYEYSFLLKSKYQTVTAAHIVFFQGWKGTSNLDQSHKVCTRKAPSLRIHASPGQPLACANIQYLKKICNHHGPLAILNARMSPFGPLDIPTKCPKIGFCKGAKLPFKMLI